MINILKKVSQTGVLSFGILFGGRVFGQNNIATPIGVYTAVNAVGTTISKGGKILVSTDGKWVLSGDITSADKGGNNSPNAIGRTEVITFDDNAIYSGAVNVAGTTGYIIDGYAASTATWKGNVLPTGYASTAYPTVIPPGTAVTAAYFPGSGTTQSFPVKGVATTEYSPYIDFPTGIVAGNYFITYPSGFSTYGYSSLLSSGNTSANGTNGNTTYGLLRSIITYSANVNTVYVALPATTPTQLYFATSNTDLVLPITLVSFSGTAGGCSANLTWESATENNSSYYAVEVNADGSGYTQVGKVPSKNSPTGTTYHIATPLGIGINYFRLKLVDVDGKYSYSNTVAVIGAGICGPSRSVSLSPNPTRDLLNINGLAVGSHIVLLNSSGQKLLEFTAMSTNQSISLAHYASGVYLVRVQQVDGTNGGIKVVKL